VIVDVSDGRPGAELDAHLCSPGHICLSAVSVAAVLHRQATVIRTQGVRRYQQRNLGRDAVVHEVAAAVDRLADQIDLITPDISQRNRRQRISNARLGDLMHPAWWLANMRRDRKEDQ
jgi:hypothetical protein